MVAVYVCTDPLTYGHRSRSGQLLRAAGTAPVARVDETDEQTAARVAAEKQATRAARAKVIAGNKAWVAAETVRRGFITQLVARKTPPQGGCVHIATVLASNPYTFSRAGERGHELAGELLGGQSTHPGQRGRERLTGCSRPPRLSAPT